jgi:hypothetical protein
LIRGRHLLDASSWGEWESRIVNTLQRTVTLEEGKANWSAFLTPPEGPEPKMLIQLCHGAPGFVVCLAHLPRRELDPLLLAGGEAIWAAGPLAKGSNLCHGTGGNGYAFLVLYQRTGDIKWLRRAQAFAMHGSEADEAAHGQLRYSLVDRRSRLRYLPVGLFARHGSVPDVGCVLRHRGLICLIHAAHRPQGVVARCH